MTFEAPETLRQSLIARFDACPRSALLEMQTPEKLPSPIAARGTLFHSWVRRALEMMRASGERTLPVEMGMELLAEVLAQRDVADGETVHTPMREMAWLRVLVTKWCESVEFEASRIVSLEERLRTEVEIFGPGGTRYLRTITGQPDVIVAAPPYGVIVVDWKAGWASPANQRHYEDEIGKDDRLSDHGYVQQVVYGLLVLANYPTVETVTLREYYVMWGEYREASIHRGQLERLSDVLAAVVAQFDAAVESGPDSERWVPTAGTHCAICPAPRRCPLRDWAGIPASDEEAQQLIGEWIVAGQVRSDRARFAKGWVAAHGPIEVKNSKGRKVVGWIENRTGEGRRFAMYEPEDAPESPFEERLGDS